MILLYRDRMCRRRSAHRRDGWTLVVVLVCLSIAMAITAAGMRTSLRARRQSTNQWQLEQTRLLLDAGIRRVARSASEQSDYEGEVWKLDGVFKAYPEARVEMKALPPDGSDNNTVRRFEVVSILRNRDDNPVQTKRSRIVSIPK